MDYGDGKKHSNTHIRLCPTIWESKEAESQIGFTLFHELMHMTSSVRDYGYPKSTCYNLAKTNPVKARHNAKSYQLFAAESSMPWKQYERVTGGMSVIDDVCKDSYGNCRDLTPSAQHCKHAKFSNGEKVSLKCCASCTHKFGSHDGSFETRGRHAD